MLKVNTFFSVSIDGFEQVNICLGYNDNLVSVDFFVLLCPLLFCLHTFPFMYLQCF